MNYACNNKYNIIIFQVTLIISIDIIELIIKIVNGKFIFNMLSLYFLVNE